jgi:hypothetical protein
MGDEAKHLNLFDQVIHALMDMGETVDSLSGEMGDSGHQVLMLRTEGQFIGEGCGFNVRPEGRVLGDILHPFSVVVDRMMKVFQALDIILFSDDSFHWFLSLMLKIMVIGEKVRVTTPVSSRGYVLGKPTFVVVEARIDTRS